MHVKGIIYGRENGGAPCLLQSTSFTDDVRRVRQETGGCTNIHRSDAARMLGIDPRFPTLPDMICMGVDHSVEARASLEQIYCTHMHALANGYARLPAPEKKEIVIQLPLALLIHTPEYKVPNQIARLSPYFIFLFIFTRLLVWT